MRLSGREPAEFPTSVNDVLAALGTLVNAEQHVAAMERYPVLGGPEVSQKQALELAKVLDGLPEGKEFSSTIAEIPSGPLLQKMQNMTVIFCMFWRA